jgi:hypothetical protein
MTKSDCKDSIKFLNYINYTQTNKNVMQKIYRKNRLNFFFETLFLMLSLPQD